MNSNEFRNNQPIRSLQTMLRIIASQDPQYLTVSVDGIYGPELMRAVSAFQKVHGLPATGVTDLETWEAVVGVYGPAQIQQAQAQHLEIILDPGQVIGPGQHHPVLYLAQAVLMALGDSYRSIPAPGISGTLDPATCQALEAFQELCGLPMTGQLDKHTWKHLALHFPLAAGLESGNF